MVNSAITLQQQQGCIQEIGCFPAGTNYFYSNTNYIILGMLIEKLTGMSFAEAFNQNILAQFQNQNVYYDENYYPDNILGTMIHVYYPYYNGSDF